MNLKDGMGEMTSAMRMRLLPGAALMLLAACAQGPGGGADYDQAAALREAELANGVASYERLASTDPMEPMDPMGLAAQGQGAAVAPVRPLGSSVSSNSAEGIAADTAAVLAASSGGTAAAPAAAVPPAPVVTSTGLSVENDFSAVSENRSIQSDAALIQQNRAQYQVIEPTALPSRSAASGPNIVAYALNTSHPKGTRVYSRSGVNLQGRAARNCAKFPSSDMAQIEFLANGGPERDRASLDPDGDGYACSWDPAPFRKAQNG
jgi:hypothetical protein